MKLPKWSVAVRWRWQNLRSNFFPVQSAALDFVCDVCPRGGEKKKNQKKTKKTQKKTPKPKPKPKVSPNDEEPLGSSGAAGLPSREEEVG